MPNLEVKQINIDEFKAIKDSSDGKMRFSGYLAYFGNVDYVGDIIEKGAFSRTIAETKAAGKVIKILENHGGYKLTAQDMTPIGYFEDMYEDSKGLYVSGVLVSTTRGKDMHTLLMEMPKGAMSMSIGYNVVAKRTPTAEEYRQKGVVRYLTDLDLGEGSVTAFPANDKAVIEDVKMAEAKKRRDLETHLKANGFSSSEAKKVVAVLSKYEGKTEVEYEPENNSEEKSTEGLTSLRGVFKSVQEQLETENSLRSLKKFMSDFPSKVLKS